MPRRKRKPALPRVTVFAMSARELLAFVSSVEQLRHDVHDLRELVKELRELKAARKRPAKPKPVPLPIPPELVTPTLPGMGERE